MFVEFYAMPLTTASVRTALPRTRLYRLSDRSGLLLEVPPAGSKRWRFRYRFNRTEKLISLGLYPTVSLRAARLQRDDARGLLARGIDPSGSSGQLESIGAFSSTYPAGTNTIPRIPFQRSR